MKKIAAVATSYFPFSHADVILSRWIDPLPSDADWGWERPRTAIASLYVAQHHPTDARDLPDGPIPVGRRTRQEKVDLSYYMAEKFQIPLFPTIHEALTLGGEALAVDGVLIIGEHGDYPNNAYGQKMYPRKELFDEVVAVFRACGRSVPVFVDKHLSWNPEWADEMVRTSEELGFALMGGSSLTLVDETSPTDGAPFRGGEVAAYIGLFHDGIEAYGFHSLELMQAQIEKRTGGESGITAVTALRGSAVWDALGAGPWTVDLFAAALGARSSLDPALIQGRIRERSELSGEALPIAFFLEFSDGLHAAHIHLPDQLERFAAALRTREGNIIVRAPRTGGPDNHFGHFAKLDSLAEEMFLTGKSPVPIARTLLTTKTIAACMHALQTPGQRIPTPGLMVSYSSSDI